MRAVELPIIFRGPFPLKSDSYISDQLIAYDRAHIWHPYSKIHSDAPLFAVDSAQGVKIRLKDGRELIDGMSSWWSVLHGYNHPALNKALSDQAQKMAHVMFGGFTHEPAVKLSRQLVTLSPESLEYVFYSDSGSVAVEVAMKMAIQFWQSQGENRNRFLTLKRGYHGDTFAAMSVCDPVTGMHHLFSDALQKQIFAPQPQVRFHQAWNPKDVDEFSKLITKYEKQIAGVILEPIVQGTGGMHFYSPEYLKSVRALTQALGIPLIADEIATGLGRTGKLFACEHAGISPDIMCLGKTLSAGYISFAATLCSQQIAETICNGEAGVFMHGPTYMGNPLACAVSARSIDLLLENDWATQVKAINKTLRLELEPCRALDKVSDVRVLGAIGVVELTEPADLKVLQPRFVDKGIWLRPFGNLVYMMPPYIINAEELTYLCRQTFETIRAL